jgi:sec-independent protein translocase protein TatA
MIADLFDSPWKILIVAVVLIVLFGSAKLPVAARSLGKSMRILKTEVKGLHEDGTQPGSATPTLAPAGTQQTIASQQQLAAQLAERLPVDVEGPTEGQPEAQRVQQPR